MRVKLNKQVDGKWGAAAVACAALVALGAFFSSVDLDQFRWSWTAVAFVAFFPVALIGLIALAYGAKGKQVTSEETDKKIAEVWVSYMNAVRLPLLLAFLLYLSYLV